MRKSWIAAAPLLSLLGLSPGASATTTIDATTGSLPVALLNGQNSAITLELGTDDNVGALDILFQATLSLSINSCTNPGGAAPGFLCTVLSPTQALLSVSDFTTGLSDGLDFVTLNVTVGGLGLGTLSFSPFPTSYWTECSGLPAFPCLPLNQTQQPFDNATPLIAIVTPEPASAALLGVGLVGLAWVGRARRH